MVSVKPVAELNLERGFPVPYGVRYVPRKFIVTVRTADDDQRFHNHCTLEVRVRWEGQPRCHALTSDQPITKSFFRQLPLDRILSQATALASHRSPALNDELTIDAQEFEDTVLGVPYRRPRRSARLAVQPSKRKPVAGERAHKAAEIKRAAIEAAGVKGSTKAVADYFGCSRKHAQHLLKVAREQGGDVPPA